MDWVQGQHEFCRGYPLDQRLQFCQRVRQNGHFARETSFVISFIVLYVLKQVLCTLHFF